MRRLGILALLLGLIFLASPARADDFQLPGLSADAGAYANGLTHRFLAAAEAQAMAAPPAPPRGSRCGPGCRRNRVWRC
ncbi:MAG TPA: hypothetical protein VGH36_10600 [Acetobacteraceae bacterium]|jgi:hypothetical protein